MTPAIYAINRAVDAERMTSVAASAEAAGLKLTRIEAFDGHDPATPLFLYRDLIGEAFWGEAEIKPGALGCYLSHIAAWRRLIADGHETALIVEDDVIFAPDAAARMEEASGAADLVFVNARMAAWAALAGAETVAPLTEVLAAMAKAGAAPGAGDLAAAPGADAYLLTAAGAQRLLDQVAAQKICCGVDWAMLALAAPTAARPDWPEFETLSPPPEGEGGLEAAILAEPLTTQTGGAASTIRHSERRPIAELFTAPEVRAADGAEGPGAVMPEGDARDPVFQAYAAGQFYETPALELLRRWMPPGGAFVDIGAHIGGHTIFMLRHGGAGRAIPVEFDRKAADALRKTVEANGLTDRVDDVALGVAFGDERRKLERFGPKYLSAARLRPGFVETVTVRPGDVLLREVDVDLIKIDVNGEEKMVMQGLKKTLRRKRPLVALDLTKPKSLKSLPFIMRMHYREAERVTWTDAEGPRAFAIFTPLDIPKPPPAAVEE